MALLALDREIHYVMRLTGMVYDHPDFDRRPNDPPSELFFTLAGADVPAWMPDWFNGDDIDEMRRWLVANNRWSPDLT